MEDDSVVQHELKDFQRERRAAKHQEMRKQNRQRPGYVEMVDLFLL